MSEKLFAGFFIIFLGALFMMNLFGNDVLFSEQENRVLTQKPSFTWNRFTSGKYTSEVEQYISDQFPLKNSWVGLKGKIERTIGKKENNGVLFGDDGYLFERFNVTNNRLLKNIKIIDSFVKQASIDNTYVLLAPTSIAVYPEKMPQFVSSASQGDMLTAVDQALSSNIKMINPYQRLITHKDEDIYFKTDHHWTMRGAYFAYQEAAEQMGFEALSMNDFNIDIASDRFQGTLYSQATAYDTKPDQLELFFPKGKQHIEVIYEDGTVSHTLFRHEHLQEKDKYAVFLDGNHSLLQIKTGLSTERKLMVIKDSYAHAFIPFLANHFDEIHVIDLRYFKQNVEEYMDQHEIQELLFLYNLPNFTTDTNIGWLQ